MKIKRKQLVELGGMYKSGINRLNKHWGEEKQEFTIAEIAESNTASDMTCLIKKVKPKKEVSVKIAVACAELVYPIYKDKYPDDTAVIGAITAAKEWLADQTEGKRKVAATATEVAFSAYSDAKFAAAAVAAFAAHAAAASDDDYASDYAAASATYAAPAEKIKAIIVKELEK